MEIPRGLHSHRGFGRGPGGFPDNSVLAIECAADNGFQVCEIDVHLSKDLVPVVVHDPELEQGSQKVAVGELTAEELNLLGIATLEEVLNCQRPQFLNIELKSNAQHRDQLTEKAREVAAGADGAYFSSFDPQLLENLPAPRALIIGTDNAEMMSLAGFDFLHLQDELVDFSKHESIKSQIVVWTVNNLKRAHELRDFGVHAVITDELEPRNW